MATSPSANPRDPAAATEAHALRAAFAHHPTLAGLRASAEWPELSRRLAAYLDRVRLQIPPGPTAPPRDRDRLRVLHWNLEHGNRFDDIARAFATHPELAAPDLVSLNEADLGMARSGNRDVAAELGSRLGLRSAWAAMFLECTRGRDDDALLAVPADNRESLFGLGLLSRWPIAAARLVPLPGPEQRLFEWERMAGRFAALVCEIAHPTHPFTAVTVHLEVHRTRAHRAAQMRLLLDALSGTRGPLVLAGDWNTHTFDRGGRRAAARGAWTLLAQPSRSLARRLARPDLGPWREPLFDDLRAAGFEWERYNDGLPTLALRFARLGEVHAMPAPLRALVTRGLTWAERRARLRLDWIAARGFRHERGSGRTIAGLDGPGLASDHAPIVAELAFV
jgi:endonuclease/exonuclease/phosphatase family metal-dependent hydrolase